MIRNEYQAATERPHYRLQKTTIGVASVLLSTTLYFGLTAHADTIAPNSADQNVPVTDVEQTSQKANVGPQVVPASSQDQSGATSGVSVDAKDPAANQEQASSHVGSAISAGSEVKVSETSATSASSQAVSVSQSGAGIQSVSAAASATPVPEASDPADELSKTITRTINIENPLTYQTISQTQRVTYTRDNQNAAWSTDHNVFDAVNVPKITGYMAYDLSGGNAVQNGKIVSVLTTPNMDNLIVNVGYRQEDGSMTINVVDENGQIVSSQVISGKTGDTKNVSLAIPDGYVLNRGQSIPTQVTIQGNQHQSIGVHTLMVHVDANDPKTAGTVIPGTQNLKFPSGLTENDLNREVSRTIEIQKADGTMQTVTQPVVEFHRGATVNAVTGAVTYDDWDQTHATIPAYILPNVEGEVPILDQGDLAAWTVDPNTISTTVHVRYVASNASVVVQFVDANDPDNEIDETDVSGVVGQDVAVDLKLPAGFQLAPGQNLPATIRLTSTNQDPIQIKVVEAHVTVTPDNPKTEDDVIPGTDDTYNYPAGVDHDSLNKTVTRDIYVKLGNGEARKAQTQTVNISRSADVNVVEGDVQYGNWSHGQFDAVNAPVQDNWVADQTSAPVAEVTFDKDGNPINQSFTFTYHEGTQNVTDTKTVTRDIYSKQGSQAPVKITTQTVTLTRNGVKNLVTGDTAWEAWQAKSMPAYTAPAVPGYSVANPDAAAAINLDGSQGSYTATFNYTANAQVIHVVYKDGNTIVKTEDLNGHTDEDVHVDVNVPTYYKETSVETNTHYHAGTGTYTFGADNNPDIIVNLGHQTQPAHEEKMVTRTVNSQVEGQTPQLVKKETATISRQGTKDLVTGVIDWQAWDTASLAAVDAPAMLGYTPDLNQVPAMTVNGDSVDSTVTIHYIANSHQMTIVYRDGQTGQIISNQSVTGKTNQTVDVNYEVPTNYHLNGDEPKQVTFGPDGHANITINLIHDTEVQHGTKDVTRVINIKKPDGTTATTKQVAHLHRDGTLDKVTNQITWGAWSRDSEAWTQVNVPAIKGYLPSQNRVDAQVVDGNTTDAEINISYAPNMQSANVVYKDADGHVIKTTPITGKDGDTIDVNIDLPMGYEQTGLAGGHNFDASTKQYTFTDGNNSDITVTMQHQLKAVQDTKKVTRTINVYMPNGEVNTTKQEVTLVRQGQQDQVTHQITWGDWSTDTWKKFKAPRVRGYVPFMKKVDAQSVDGSTVDTTVNITYVAGDQAINIIYKDGNKVIKTVPITGKTNEMVHLTYDVPTNYHIEGGKTDMYTFLPDDNPDIIVNLGHDTEPATDHEAITRTIEITTPDGKTMTTNQTIDLTRPGTRDKVTGETAWTGEWTTGHFDQFDIPDVPGYTPSISNVPAMEVQHGIPSSTVHVTYTANSQVVNIVYKDGDKVIKTVPVTGHTGETVDLNYDLPNNYDDNTSNLPKTYTFTGVPGSDIVVSLTHQTKAVSESRDVTRTIHVAMPDGTTKDTVQTATITREGVQDKVNGNTTWGAWSTSQWDEFKAPAVDGYEFNLATVAEEQVNGNTQNSEVFIKSTPLEQTVNIIYKDGDKVVKTTPITSYTGEQVTPKYEAPTNYDIENPDSLPKTITVSGKGGNDILINVRHQTQSQREAKTVTRTIKVHTPAGEVNTTVQSATISRQGILDKVTGQVQWGAWTTADWVAFNAPLFAGYTASMKNVPVQDVDENTTNSTVDIYYMADEQEVHVVYQTPDGTSVHTDTIHGRTGETISVPNDVPGGYHLEGNIPGTVTILPNGTPDIIVAVVPNEEPSNKPSEKPADQPVTKPVAQPQGQAQTVKTVVEAPAQANGKAQAQAQAKSLPQTNGKSEAAAVGLGLAGMFAGLAGLFGGKKRHE